MGIIPASTSMNQLYNVQNPTPSMMDNFATIANSALTGYNTRQEQGKSDIRSMFPVLAQYGMLRPGQTGEQGGFKMGGFNWMPQNKAPDPGDIYKGLQTEELSGELGKRPLSSWQIRAKANQMAQKDPQYASLAAAGGFDLAGNPVDLDSVFKEVADRNYSLLKAQQDSIFDPETAAKTKTVSLSKIKRTREYKNNPKQMMEDLEAEGWTIVDDVTEPTSAPAPVSVPKWAKQMPSMKFSGAPGGW